MFEVIKLMLRKSMETKKLIRLSLLSSLLVVLNGCGDGSSEQQDKQDETRANVERV